MSGTAKQDGRPVVRWEELKPEEFHRRLATRLLAYLPMGMCEPGGIVAPSQTYHIHETGFHGTWFAEVVGEVNPRLGALPPDVVMGTLLFRACVNAGFRAVHPAALQALIHRQIRGRAVHAHRISRSVPAVAGSSNPHRGYLETWCRIGVRPDSVQVSGGTLPHCGCLLVSLAWLSHGLRSRRAPCEERLKRGLPSSK